MSAARLRLVECRAILGGERDPFRAVWDDQTTVKDRRLLLAMAGKTTLEAGRLDHRRWIDLPGECRSAILGGMARWREWSEKMR